MPELRWLPFQLQISNGVNTIPLFRLLFNLGMPTLPYALLKTDLTFRRLDYLIFQKKIYLSNVVRATS